MPAWIYVLAVAAVLTVAWYGWARRWVHSWRYSWARARHMVDVTQTEVIPGAEFLGSMLLDDDRTVTWDPPAYLLAAPVDPEPWRTRTMAELSPEALDPGLGGGAGFEITEHFPEPPGGWDSLGFGDDDPGAGDADVVSSAPAPDPHWLEAQMAATFNWSREVRIRLAAI